MQTGHRLMDGLMPTAPPFDGRVEAEGPPVDGRLPAASPVAVTIIAIGHIILHPVGSIPGVIVMINLISIIIIYYYGIPSAIMPAIITSMVIIIIMTINANGHTVAAMAK